MEAYTQRKPPQPTEQSFHQFKMHGVLRVVMCMALSIMPAHAQDATSVAPQPQPHASAPVVSRESFLRRLMNAYREDWNGTASSGPEPPRRIPASPLTSPPFPSADWTYGGAPVIGATNTTDYPLMHSLYAGPNGAHWTKSRVQVYGWVAPGFNFSTSTHSNLPAGYDIVPNRIELDQAVLYVERVPDTVQTDHVDWGFRAANFFGIDYHFTTAKGWLSQQLLQQHRLYGDDPVMLYGDLYIPHVAKGLNIRFGRFISLPDIEAQLAPQNYSYTHSLLYSYDPFTQTGVVGTVMLNNHWLVSLGISAGNDIAPWAKGAKPSLTACVSYTFNNGKDNIYPCASGINKGKYAYNNVQLYVNTWYHKFNDSWHMATEAYYEFERDVPSVSSTLPVEPNTNGALCPIQEARCFAGEWSAVNYLQKEFSKSNYVSLRNEVLDDARGQRTGFRTVYSEHTVMWGHWIGTTLLFRPELRFERAYSAPAYDNGTRKTQLSFAADMVFRF